MPKTVLPIIPMKTMSDKARKEIEKAKRGIEKYLAIMRAVEHTNVAEDAAFQHLFNGFYQVRRNAAWRRTYYAYMEAQKGKNLGIEEVMTYLQRNASGERVELSFASKLLHTLDPTRPIYDRKVAAYLDLAAPPAYWQQDKKFACQLANYREIEAWYRTPSAQALADQFDRLFPEYRDQIGRVKKIDFIIWRELSDD